MRPARASSQESGRAPKVFRSHTSFDGIGNRFSTPTSPHPMARAARNTRLNVRCPDVASGGLARTARRRREAGSSDGISKVFNHMTLENLLGACRRANYRPFWRAILSRLSPTGPVAAPPTAAASRRWPVTAVVHERRWSWRGLVDADALDLTDTEFVGVVDAEEQLTRLATALPICDPETARRDVVRIARLVVSVTTVR